MLVQGDYISDVFVWDFYLIVGNLIVYKGILYVGSENILVDNMFNSFDGIGFDIVGCLWI